MQELINLKDFECVFLEASPYRSDILKQIDEDFAALKKERINKHIKSLMHHIMKFTKINKVVISIKSDYNNAFVVPLYNRKMSLDLLEILKDYSVDMENIRKLDVVEEPSKYIDSLYVVFGDNILSTFSPRELTSILLHELGHGFSYTSDLPLILVGILRKIFITLEVLPKFLLVPLISLSLIHLFYITATCFVICRSLTFLEHRGEFKADQFAAKYGYADEMITTLNKLNNIELEVTSKYSWWKKIWNFLYEIFVPSTHPKTTKRMIELSDKMLNEYKKMYPNISRELTIILNDLKK